MLRNATLEQEALSCDEIQEVISFKPNWIVRKGSFLLLIIILVLFSLTWFIRYPDTIDASARLVALNPPIQMVARSEGKLSKLYIESDQQVTKGQVLGYVVSTADYSQVIQLQNWIKETAEATESNSYTHLLKAPLPYLTSLGELQNSFQKLQNDYIMTRQTLASGYFDQKKLALQKDINLIANLDKNNKQQHVFQEQDKALQQKELDAYEKLAADKVIAPLELDQYKSKLLAKEQALTQANSQITNTNITHHGKQKELMDLQKQVLDQQQLFRSSLFAMKSEVEQWIQKYIFIAPIAGKVTFPYSLQENQLVIIGQPLFYIQPEQTQYFSEVTAGQRGFGKIKVGQKVMIKVESYPSNQYGSLVGRIDYISSIPNRSDSFQIKVSLLRGLLTNYGSEIFFRNDLLAHAQIITDNRRLFDRLTAKMGISKIR